jgi:hypothetical protein
VFNVSGEIASQGASRFEVRVGGQTVVTGCADTGGYDSFKKLELGNVKVEAGSVRVEVRPVAGGWKPINLRSVRLRPAE